MLGCVATCKCGLRCLFRGSYSPPRGKGHTCYGRKHCITKPNRKSNLAGRSVKPPTTCSLRPRLPNPICSLCASVLWVTALAAQRWSMLPPSALGRCSRAQISLTAKFTFTLIHQLQQLPSCLSLLLWRQLAASGAGASARNRVAPTALRAPSRSPSRPQRPNPVKGLLKCGLASFQSTGRGRLARARRSSPPTPGMPSCWRPAAASSARSSQRLSPLRQCGCGEQ